MGRSGLYKKPFPTFPHPAQPSDTSMHGQSTSSLNIAKKKLPAVPIPPLGTLGLDLHGASYARSPRQAAVNENDSRRSESYTGNIAQPSSPTVLSSSPSTILSSPLSRFPYNTTTNHSSSTLTSSTTSILRNHSITTLANPGSPPIPSLPTLSQSASPSKSLETPISKRRTMFKQPSLASSSLACSEHDQVRIQRSMSNAPSSDTSGTGTSFVPLSKKKSSGQLLMGISKGLHRVGSVMRRNNTADGRSGSASSTPLKNVMKSAPDTGTGEGRRVKSKMNIAEWARRIVRRQG
ncbi:hypothetical protein C351_02440 [Cryptococcus neoformans c8]|nr:hypothetical protein C353_02719 [Cryptococcus neoformans var. grubii AD1-83a]OXG61524.1 hypothetical protein C354_02655 [Cryptococcus neoformans var. grubii MW-RSA1955]OXG64829.1 hypothetical protein C351_02440 [Cryptococcus neoformans var. grubii c8]OXG66592.1 hypothetical protein C352_02665 [Cryptococcus neoformans var. grubii CHC193]OXH12694.1 hypothetical protein C369_02699 [Cryptococcus neoformans var. grubii A5-35-17]OXH13597.1 hypothetical protein C370_02710 [Cryptococcus neoformans 